MADGAAETVAKAGAVLTADEKVLVDAIARLSLEVAAEQRKSEALVVERGDCIRSMRATLERLTADEKVLVDAIARLSLEVAAEQRKSEALVVERGDCIRSMRAALEQLALGDKDEAARHLRGMLRLMGVKP